MLMDLGAARRKIVGHGRLTFQELTPGPNSTGTAGGATRVNYL